jgi:hypothetical protein
MLIVEDQTVTEIQNSNKSNVPLLYLCLSVMLESLSCSFASLPFLTNLGCGNSTIDFNMFHDTLTRYIIILLAYLLTNKIYFKQSAHQGK